MTKPFGGMNDSLCNPTDDHGHDLVGFALHEQGTTNIAGRPCTRPPDSSALHGCKELPNSHDNRRSAFEERPGSEQLTEYPRSEQGAHPWAHLLDGGIIPSSAAAPDISYLLLPSR